MPFCRFSILSHLLERVFYPLEPVLTPLECFNDPLEWKNSLLEKNSRGHRVVRAMLRLTGLGPASPFSAFGGTWNEKSANGPNFSVSFGDSTTGSRCRICHYGVFSF